MSLLQEALVKAGRQPAEKLPQKKSEILNLRQIYQKREFPSRAPLSFDLSSSTQKIHKATSSIFKDSASWVSRHFIPIAGMLCLASATLIFWVYKPFGFLKASNPSDSQSISVNSSVRSPRVRDLVPNLDPLPRFQLTGITTVEGEELALINNQVVGVGDLTREKALIKKIQNRSVLLEIRGREISLSL